MNDNSYSQVTDQLENMFKKREAKEKRTISKEHAYHNEKKTYLSTELIIDNKDIAFQKFKTVNFPYKFNICKP
jgi:hypothetical protein